MDPARRYESIYRDHGFERLGLFLCLRDAFAPARVASVGSSIHIAVSFVFPDVTYIDRDPETAAFFAEADRVRDYVESRKEYRRPARLAFLNLDYRTGPLPAGAFDLVVAFFAPDCLGVAAALAAPGGVVAHLPLPAERGLPAPDGLCRIGTAVEAGGRYRVTEGEVRPRRRGPGRRTEVFREDNAYALYRREVR